MRRDLLGLKHSKNILHKCLNSAKLLPTDSDSFDSHHSSILGVHHFFFYWNTMLPRMGFELTSPDY